MLLDVTHLSYPDRQLPRRIDDGAAQHTFTSIECFYRKEYFQAIDVVKADLEK